MADESLRRQSKRALEQDAELLVVYQLDLLAQIEAQLRAVHHTMRTIEKLRGPATRVGPELSNGQRREMLEELSRELASVETHLDGQHESCRDMQDIIDKMRRHLAALRAATARAFEAAADLQPDDEPDTGGSVSPP